MPLKFLLTFSLLALLLNLAPAQTTTCGFDQVHQNWLKQNNNRHLVEKFESAYQLAVANGWQKSSAPYVLPVVVHVIHDNGSENISDQQIRQGIDHLNQAFANLDYYNPDTGVDVEVEFCLAKRDPSGAATTGINRVQSSLTEFDYSIEENDFKDLSRWDPTQYINIWVAREICSSAGCGVIGYAYFPAAHGTNVDGIVVEAPYIGRTPSNSAVLAHEMGHYLGLYHTFQDGCDNNDCLADGDRVCDTPPDQTTVRTVCDAVTNSCTTDEDDASANNPFRSTGLGGLGDQPDQFQNYMDYSRLECFDRFTEGQKTRMHFAIENQRQSLLNSNACVNPCPSPISVQISASATDIEVGETVQFTQSSVNGETYNWLLDGTSFSTDASTPYTFNSEGNFQVILEVSNLAPNCFTQRDTVNIRVTCPVVAGFEFERSGDLELTFTDTSRNAIRVEYMIYNRWGDLVYSGTDRNFVVNFSASGVYVYSLIVEGEYCDRQINGDITVFSESEICDNGLDDDGNGLIDCFDPDCDCTESCLEFYGADCNDQNCRLEISTLPSKTLWVSQGAEVCNWSQLTVGDIDNDGLPEVFGARSDGPAYAFSGQDGSVKYIYDEGPSTSGSAHVSIANLDADNFGEIVLWQDNQLRAYEHNGLLKWETRRDFNSRIREIQIADVNYDGIPEVICGNYIFNGLDGSILIMGSGTPGKHPAYGSVGHVVLADVLGESECANCQGLELVYGSQVYSISLNSLNSTTGNSIQLEKSLSNYSNGYTSIADLDRDGELEIIVSGIDENSNESVVYAWNASSESLKYNPFVYNTRTAYGGRVTVSDSNADGVPELFQIHLSNSGTRLVKLNDELNALWTIPFFDPTSSTMPTLFDLNGDGVKEVIVRGSNRWLILNSVDGAVIESDFCTSGTVTESPVVADVNGDERAEIIFTCGGTTDVVNVAEIRCLSAMEEDWMPARKVWNQKTYFNTNVFDDLNIPRQQQSPHLIRGELSSEFNSFNVQFSPRVNLPDFTMTAKEDSLCMRLEDNCAFVEIDIFQVQEDLNAEAHIVERNPDGTFSLLKTVDVVRGNNPVDEQVSEVICLEEGQFEPGQWYYILLNIDESNTTNDWLDGFPGDFEECEYSNNIDSFYIRPIPQEPELGPDIEVCDNQIFNFNVGGGYLSYRWSDGSRDSTYTAYEEGLHWVEVTDECGNVFRDSVMISYSPVTQVDFGEDLQVCSREELQLSVPDIYQGIEWYPTNIVDCPACPQVQIESDTSVTITVLVDNGRGCYSSDSVRIEFKEQIEENLELRPCEGEAVEFDGRVLTEGGIYIDTLTAVDACDTIVELSLAFQPAYEFQMTEWICKGDSFLLDDQWVDSSGLYTINYQTNAGCDSTFLLNLEVRNRDSSEIKQGICKGDSLQFGEAWLKEAGIYQYVGEEIYCDSLYLLDLQLDDTFYTELEYTLCAGDSVEVTGEWLSKPGMYTYELSSSKSCDSTVVAIVEPVEFGSPPEIEVNCEEPLVLANLELTGNFTQQWSNGDTSSSTIYQGGDSAWVVVFRDASCGKEYRFGLPSLPDFFELPDWEDSTAFRGEPFLIDLGLDSTIWSARWAPSAYVSCDTCLRTRLIYDENASIELELTHSSGCVYNYLFSIRWEEQNHMYVPNSFSPNDDGANDFWELYAADHVDLILEAAIYNRWGGEMRRWKNVEEVKWNGRFSGEPMNPGVYVYYIRYITTDGKERLLKGDVTLWR